MGAKVGVNGGSGDVAALFCLQHGALARSASHVKALYAGFKVVLYKLRNNILFDVSVGVYGRVMSAVITPLNFILSPGEELFAEAAPADKPLS